MSGLRRVVGMNFDHMHMGDNLAFAHRHPGVELVGVCDERVERMASAVGACGLGEERVFTDWRACLEETQPELVILCPATGEHALWVERVAPYGCHVLLEKPFAASLEEADAMIAAMEAGGGRLAINWPLAWYPPHVTAKRLIDEGRIGSVLSVNYYDGNRGPLYHVEAKAETSAAFRDEEKAQSWFYKRELGGGSLLDYLGYGATLGTWFLGGALPRTVTTVVDQPQGLEVDEHSITIARYESGLCRFETRWGTFTDPWTHQPQPKCGFEIVGEEGTITSYDYEESVRLQTVEEPQGVVIPVDELVAPMQDPVQYMIHCIETGASLEGPLSIAMARVGQQIVDSAVSSASAGRTVELVG
jgi:glucose-fructose oxidoreductase